MSGTISPRDRLQLWVNTFLLKQKENSGSVTATFRDQAWWVNTCQHFSQVGLAEAAEADGWLSARSVLLEARAFLAPAPHASVVTVSATTTRRTRQRTLKREEHERISAAKKKHLAAGGPHPLASIFEV